MTRDPLTNRPSDFDGIDKIFTNHYFLTPGECNPQQRMPLTLLINRLIEIATLHANQVGIGYAFLTLEHQTWVLSRVAVEMKRYPGVNENYSISTWISSISRLFSERDFEICGEGGEVIGHARTVWAVIDTRTRQVGDISRIAWIKELVPQKESPVEKPSRPRAVAVPAAGEAEGYREAHYRFQYTDIDFNRHVNSSRYIELLLNQWGLDFHDANRLTRFEIAYIHEAHFDMEVTLRLQDEQVAIPATAEAPAITSATRAELIGPDGQPMFRALLRFSPR
jgi:acyl-ACP thioesterase